MFFVLAYRRSESRLLELTRFASTDFDRAWECKLDADKRFGGSDVEVVLLESENERSLRATHARFFRTLEELASDPFDSGAGA